jgi:hypothetical protein
MSRARTTPEPAPEWDAQPEQDWTNHDRGGVSIEEWTTSYSEHVPIEEPPPPDESEA